MNKSPFTRLAMATVATGFATLAFAAPANANMALEPDAGNVVEFVNPTPAPPAEPGTDWGQLAVAAAAGVALAGAGAAAVAGTRRRNHHLANPV